MPFSRVTGTGYRYFSSWEEMTYKVLLRSTTCGVYVWGGRMGRSLRIFFLYIFFLLFISSLYNLASLELRENLLTYLPE